MMRWLIPVAIHLTDGYTAARGVETPIPVYAGRLAMEIKARKEVKNGARTDLFKIMEEHGRDRLTSGVWERALNHGDDLATRLIDRAVKMLGVGIASSVNLLDPEAVIVGGALRP